MPEDTYLAALGRSVYAIAHTEWLVIEVARRLDPGLTLETLAGKTTGGIACKFRAAVTQASIGNTQLSSALEAIADDWLALVDPRNDVMHARPATADDGAQRLCRWKPGATARFITDDVLADLTARALEIGARLAPLRSQL